MPGTVKCVRVITIPCSSRMGDCCVLDFIFRPSWMVAAVGICRDCVAIYSLSLSRRFGCLFLAQNDGCGPRDPPRSIGSTVTTREVEPRLRIEPLDADR